MSNKTIVKTFALNVFTLLICVGLLIGVTYSLFTTQFTVGVNKIEAGDLDVALLDPNDNSLEGEMLDFIMYADGSPLKELPPMWGPGDRLLTESFKIVNKGRLALEYSLVVSSVDGDESMKNAMEWRFLEHNGSNTTELQISGILGPGESTNLIQLEGYMDIASTNENMNLTISKASITVFATQAPVEYDSYDNQYDDAANPIP